jgi:stearoyl-CoA desaturase (delta-9 desaturase)
MKKTTLFLYRLGLGSFLGGYHLALFILAPLFILKFGLPSLGVLASTFVLFALSGIAITAGYHRYFSHRSFKTNALVEAVLLFFGTVAVQGSALRWGYEHRLHHAYVDTDKDPYSIKKGFWYAHFLWLFDAPSEVNPKLVGDLVQNKMLMFQYRFYAPLVLITNAVLILAVGYLFHNYWAAFIFAGLFRIFLLHHFTWFINSLAHTWGSQMFSREHSAVDNYVISLVTFGEGYHNYHHTFCSDYRNGIKWFNFDPTKWLIWTLEKLGLATDLKRTKTYIMKKKQILYDTQFLTKRLKSLLSGSENREQMEQNLSQSSKKLLDLLSKLSDSHALYERMKNNLKDAAPAQTLQKMQKDLQTLKLSFEEQWKSWMSLSKQILQAKEPVRVS